jgi:methionyl-tRNA formyltransferase
MRIAFLGSGAFGLPTLEAIAAAHDVPLVVSQPDRPAGRGRRDTPTPISERVLVDRERGDGAFASTTLLRTDDINGADARAVLDEVSPDALVVIAFGQKIGPAVLDGRFAVNLHASVLPRWRGAAPINRAMMAGDASTGVSVISLAERMDAGDVHAVRETVIDPAETAGELHDRLAALGPSAVLEVLERFGRGEIRAESQDESLATRAAKLGRADATVDFSMTPDLVRARIHGLVPWPGCEVVVESPVGEKASTIDRLRLHRVEVASDANVAGLASGTLDAAGLVACDGGAVRLLEVQAPGGRVLDWDSFQRGRALPAGTILRPRTEESVR